MLFTKERGVGFLSLRREAAESKRRRKDLFCFKGEKGESGLPFVVGKPRVKQKRGGRLGFFFGFLFH